MGLMVLKVLFLVPVTSTLLQVCIVSGKAIGKGRLWNLRAPQRQQTVTTCIGILQGC